MAQSCARPCRAGAGYSTADVPRPIYQEEALGGLDRFDTGGAGGTGLGSDWPEYHVDLADGVAVCLVTDGFEDARRDGARLGRAEVERLVAAQARPDAACLLSDLGTLADQVSDDTAAVVVARA